MHEAPFTDNLTFLLSSEHEIPERFFQGYAFAGSNLIVDEPGATDYQSTTGRWIRPGEDGCYVTINPSPAGPVVGIDHAGLKKLFVYDRHGVWCVSNSLARMVHYLRTRGETLRPNWAQLAALHVSGHSLTEQMSAPETVFVDIRLVPLGRALLLTERGPREIAAVTQPAPAPYRKALEVFLSVWRARMRTLIESGHQVGADLSGGLDSRVVFALVADVGKNQLDDLITFTSGMSERQRTDYEVAKLIAERFGFGLNRPRQGTGVPPYTPRESYAAWRGLSLGVYLPIYAPSQRLTAQRINLSGLGGEVHRPFYPQLPPREFVDRYPSNGPAYFAEAWRSDLTALLQRWSEDQPNLHPAMRHYREFRSRIHGGLFAQTKVNVTPLSSYLADPLINTDRRFYYDVMEHCAPGLMDMPYDVSKKAPTEDERASLSRLDEVREVDTGRVFAGAEVPVSEDRNGRSFVDRLEEDLMAAASSRSRIARDFLGDRTVDRAIERVVDAQRAGRLGSARTASDVARVLTVAWVLDPQSH